MSVKGQRSKVKGLETRVFGRLIVLVAVLAMFGSCKYKDLCYDHNHWSEPNLVLKLDLKLDLDIDVEVSEEAHTKIDIPTYMVVCFYDLEDGSLKKMEFVGPYGGPLQVNPGTYNMVVYSFDTEWTQVRGEGNVSTLEAFTSDITAMKLPVFSKFEQDTTEAPGPIIYTPDHLLVTQQVVEIPPYTDEEHVITIEATVGTIVETYSFEVKNIEGIEYVASVDAFVTNQARANYFGIGELCQEPATIYFPMEVNRETWTLKTSFNTFGKLPGESRSYLNILVTDTKGQPYTHITDITEQFKDTAHTIVIEDSIVVPKPAGGGTGISPTVDPWDEENTDVPIG